MSSMVRSIKRNIARKNMEAVGFEKMNKSKASFAGLKQDGRYSEYKVGSIFAKNWKEYVFDRFARKKKARSRKKLA